MIAVRNDGGIKENRSGGGWFAVKFVCALVCGSFWSAMLDGDYKPATGFWAISLNLLLVVLTLLLLREIFPVNFRSKKQPQNQPDSALGASRAAQHGELSIPSDSPISPA